MFRVKSEGQRSKVAGRGLTLKLTLLRIRLASAVLMALSNWRRTWRASWGVICWVWTQTRFHLTFDSRNLRRLHVVTPTTNPQNHPPTSPALNDQHVTSDHHLNTSDQHVMSGTSISRYRSWSLLEAFYWSCSIIYLFNLTTLYIRSPKETSLRL